MKIENHIQDILQLYEFGMAIGKSLDYKTNCDSFLKLLLKRKNLNAAWILEHNQQKIQSTFSIPAGNDIYAPFSKKIKEQLTSIKDFTLLKDNKDIVGIATIKIEKGTIAICNLKHNSYLVLYTNKDNLTEKYLTKLKPIIDKFSVSLEACRTFKSQERLLLNLKAQNEELNYYAHLISHDLKSPLQSIEALTSWIIEDYTEEIDTLGKENLMLIKENVEKMDALVNGISEYSNIGGFQKEIKDVDVNAIITNIITKLEKHHNLEFKFNNQLPTIKGNKFRIHLLFLHLIKNAIQFNNKRVITIEIGSREKANYWEFYVKDNGVGIDKKYFDKIFMAFQKLEDNYTASGIGLTIVKKIIEIYEGEIWLESAVNKGSIFNFKLNKNAWKHLI